MAILQAIGVAIILSLGSAKAQDPGGNLPSYLVNVTNYGTIATQWNQVGQLAVKRNNSGPINAAATFFLLSQCMLLTRNEWSKQNNNARMQTALHYAAYQALRYIRPESEAFYREKFAQLTAAGATGLNPTLVGATIPGGSPQAIANTVCSTAWAVRASTFLTGGRGNDSFPFTATNPHMNPNFPLNKSTVVDVNKWQPLQLAARQSFLGRSWYTADGYAATPRDLQLPIDGAAVPNLFYFNDNVNRANSPWYTYINEIITLSGQLNDLTKTIVEFWAAGPGTSFPAGMWNWFAQLASLQRNQGLDDDLNLYYAVSTALFDASVGAWTQKRLISGFRPLTAVRYTYSGVTINAWGGPSRPSTGPIDGSLFWAYQPGSLASPPFPGWVSGHSTFSSAASTAMRLFYGGNDTMKIQVTIPPGASIVEPGLVPSTNVSLYWETFTVAAQQAGYSRVLGGIHVTPDNTGGSLLGRTIGNLSFYKAQQYFASGKSKDKADARPSITAVLANPKEAKTQDLLAVCHAFVAVCKDEHLAILMNMETQPLASAALFNNRETQLPEDDDYGDITFPCFTCTGNVTTQPSPTMPTSPPILPIVEAPPPPPFPSFG